MKPSTFPTMQDKEHYLRSVRQWFKTDKANYLLSLEKPLQEEAIARYFGRFLLQAGPVFTVPKNLDDIDEVVYLGCRIEGEDITADEELWPILTESIDVAVLQHTLDFAFSPHDVLREAARCIRPGGHLLISNLNPYSLWGVYRRCDFGILNDTHSISYNKLIDWLRLLGFIVEHKWTGGYGLPKTGYTIGKKSYFETLGQRHTLCGNGFYMVSARKMMIQMTLSEKGEPRIFAGLTPLPIINQSDINE